MPRSEPEIVYDWDKEKRRANLKNHKLDFRDAWQIYEHPNKVTVMDPYPHEERFRDYAAIKGTVRMLVYTMRDEAVRCISFRAAEPDEESWYYEEITNR